MAKFDLEIVLVPAGLLLMVVYHIWLFYQILHNPARTVVGMNAINRRFWVTSMMEDTQKTGILAVQTLRNNIMASTLLASTSIMLSSLIAVLMTGGATGHGGIAARGNTSDHLRIGLTYGEGIKLKLTTKFFSILVCFFGILLDEYSVSSILQPSFFTNFTNHHLTAEYVGSTVNLGSYFRSLDLRCFNFSFPLFLLFGVIPMFISSIFLVFILYFLDLT